MQLFIQGPAPVCGMVTHRFRTPEAILAKAIGMLRGLLAVRRMRPRITGTTVAGLRRQRITEHIAAAVGVLSAARHVQAVAGVEGPTAAAAARVAAVPHTRAAVAAGVDPTIRIILSQLEGPFRLAKWPSQF